MKPAELTVMFNKMDSQTTRDAYWTTKGKGGPDFDDIEDILEEMKENGDYSMLPLAIVCMKNLTPFDLRSFFETFSEIEEYIFKKKGIPYNGVSNAYATFRSNLEDKYIDFAVSYYNASLEGLTEALDTMSQENKDFLMNRFTTVQKMLIEIGKRLSSAYYSDIIVDDSCRN